MKTFTMGALEPSSRSHTWAETDRRRAAAYSVSHFGCKQSLQTSAGRVDSPLDEYCVEIVLFPAHNILQTTQVFDLDQINLKYVFVSIDQM